MVELTREDILDLVNCVQHRQNFWIKKNNIKAIERCEELMYKLGEMERKLMAKQNDGEGLK